MKKRCIDLKGQRFGRLVVLERSGSSRNGQAIWLCGCDCGSTKIICSGNLLHGITKSCGCLQVELARKQMTTHGMSGTPTYCSWRRMLDRCYYKSNPSFQFYGACGIKVCKRWQKFENFFADMGERPKGMTLDRKNNSKDYLPSNCQWSSPGMQANNRRDSRLITFRGKTQTIAQWSRELEMPYTTLSNRLVRSNWSIEQALTKTGGEK